MEISGRRIPVVRLLWEHADWVQFPAPRPFVVLLLRASKKKMHYIYIIKCKDGSFYTGITWNLEKRLNEHNLRTKTCLQKSKIPVKLVYWEKFSTIKEAAKREKEIKGWRREKKEKLINDYNEVYTEPARGG